MLAYSGKPQDGNVERAFEAGRSKLDMDIQLLEKNALNLSVLNKALNQLARLKPLKKPQLLKACAACIVADEKITATEAELFRAIADTIDCPMPPLGINL